MEWFFDGLGTAIIAPLIIGFIGGGGIGYRIGYRIGIKKNIKQSQKATAKNNANIKQIQIGEYNGK
jgi:hypothetical protein